MNNSYDRSWEILKEVLDRKSPIAEAWGEFIIRNEEHLSPQVFSSLKELDVESEQKEISDWISSTIINTPIPKGIIAIWLGMLKVYNEVKDEVPTVYVVGARTYAEDDMEWASDPDYLPKRRYAQPDTLQKIDNIIRLDPENYSYLDWILPLAYCAFSFDALFRTTIDKTLFLKHVTKMYVTVGYDSGDGINLSPIIQ